MLISQNIDENIMRYLQGPVVVERSLPNTSLITTGFNFSMDGKMLRTSCLVNEFMIGIKRRTSETAWVLLRFRILSIKSCPSEPGRMFVLRR